MIESTFIASCIVAISISLGIECYVAYRVNELSDTLLHYGAGFGFIGLCYLIGGLA